jgi:tetratricopeptide (TPR) repeat protein
LAAFYPHPSIGDGRGLLGAGLAALLVLVAVTVLFVRLRRRLPQLLVGWLWTLGMLVPVIGIVQVGEQAWADRYAYLPLVGIQIGIVFALAALAPRLRPALAIAAAVVVIVLAGRTSIEAGYWKDSRTLFERALAVTEANWVAHNNLGLVLLEQRELAPAEQHFRAACAAHPRFPEARFNLGLTLQAAGRVAEAEGAWREALALQPGHAQSLVGLAALARNAGDVERANELHQRAIDENPELGFPWAAFARALLEQGELDRAANCASGALRLDERLSDPHLVLGEIALHRNDLDAAAKRQAPAARDRARRVGRRPRGARRPAHPQR